MTNEQFEFELGRHGADLARWPADLRGEAEALVARSPEAAALRRDALALDRLLAAGEPGAGVPPDVQAMIGRIVVLPQEPAPSMQRPARLRRVPLRYAACLLAALAGFAVGAYDQHNAGLPSDLLDLAFGAPTGGFDAL